MHKREKTLNFCKFLVVKTKLQAFDAIRVRKHCRFFARWGQKVTILVIFRRVKLNFGAIIASAEGASEKIKVICWETTYDVIIFKFQGGAFAPPCTPLVTPMSTHAFTFLCPPINPGTVCSAVPRTRDQHDVSVITWMVDFDACGIGKLDVALKVQLIVAL